MADQEIVDEIREQWRRRQTWARAEQSLKLQAQSLCRRLVGGDLVESAKLYRSVTSGSGGHELAPIAAAATFPLTEAASAIRSQRMLVEKRLTSLAAKLPAADWVKSVSGFGLLSFAAIVGEAGDLSGYAAPAKLWKRMGLAVMADGQRQRRVGGADAITHGFSATRRAVVWNLGVALLRKGTEYKRIYDARKLVEAGRVETKGHAHNRAQRYMEKRVLRDLWLRWIRA